MTMATTLAGSRSSGGGLSATMGNASTASGSGGPSSAVTGAGAVGASSSSSSSAPVDFRALYQNSLKLTTAIDDFGIPRLEKSLEQLDDASQRFTGGVTAPSSSSVAAATSARKKRPATSTLGGGRHGVDKANFLLAAKGIDAEKLSRELQAFEITPGFEPETPLGETVIDGFLTHHHEMIVLTAIEDGTRRTLEATHDRMNQAMIDDFEAAKRQLLEDLGGAARAPLGARSYPRIADHLAASSVFAQGASASATNSMGMGMGMGSGASLRFDLSQSGTLFSPGSSASASASSRLHQSQFAPSQMTEEMKLYHAVIRDLHASRIPGARNQFDLVGALARATGAQVSRASVGAKWDAVHKCWQVLQSMLTGGAAAATSSSSWSSSSRAGAIAENEFAATATTDDVAAAQREQRFAHGARAFLEQQFRSFVQQTVQKQQLPTGGVPDLVSSLRAFVKYLHGGNANVSSSMPLAVDAAVDIDPWALIYYCLRCGGEQEALDLATSYLRAGDSPIDAAVLAGLRHRLQEKTNLTAHRGAAPLTAFSKQSPNEYGRLVDRYHRLTSTSVDAVAVVNPYERCVLNLLCLGNPNASEPRILTTIEDYLWQRLCFIQRGAGSAAAPDSAYSIARLAKSIHKFGPSHFEGPKTATGGPSSPFLYFEILLIAQEFEAAIQYLGSRGLLLEAAHFALALHYYGLLGATPALGDEDSGVDVVRLVRQYIHGFQRTNACEAAEYIACLSDLPAKKELLVDLLLETRQFDVLAGFTNNTDGSRTRGLLDRLLKDVPEEELRELLLQAARRAEARGQPHDALALLKCAGDVEGVIALLNTQLSSTLAAPRPERDEWFRHAKDFAEKWMRFPWVQGLANKYARTAAVAFQTLLNVNVFLEIVERQHYEDAIRFVDELEILPTPSANNLAVCVDRFLAFDETVRQNFHLVLLGYVECLVRDTERVKSQTTGELRRVAITTLREKAELVVTFAGMVKFRLPPGTNERLNRMEAMIY